MGTLVYDDETKYLWKKSNDDLKNKLVEDLVRVSDFVYKNLKIKFGILIPPHPYRK